MSRAVWLALAALAVTACERAQTAPSSPRAAMAELARCALDGVGDAPRPDVLEAALRRALRDGRSRFALRAGRCEEALSAARDPCLDPLRARWSSLLTEAQRPEGDVIFSDVAVRRVGEAWSAALSHCR